MYHVGVMCNWTSTVHVGARPLNQCQSSILQASSVKSHISLASGSAVSLKPTLNHLDLRLQSCRREGLDHLFRRFRGNFHLLTEDVPDSCLRRWFCASFDPAESWNREDAILLHLGTGDLDEGCKNIGADPLLQLMLPGQRLRDLALGHLLL